MSNATESKRQPKRTSQQQTEICCVLLVLLLAIAVWLTTPTVGRGRVSASAQMGIEVSTLAQAVAAFNSEYGLVPDFSGDDLSDQKSIERILPGSVPERISELKQLDSAEALVFWLGSGLREFAPPFYEFAPSRLLDADNDGHPEFYPAGHGAPYVYVQSAQNAEMPAAVSILNGSVMLRPYRLPDSLKLKHKFQIICAGKDNQFGDGGRFPTGEGYSPNDSDNITNFSEGKTLKECIP